MKSFRKIKNSNLFNENKTLIEIANDLQLDKGTLNKNELIWGQNWPDYYSWGYVNTYIKYMTELRYDNIKLLEIGICDKRFPYASCRMWLTYFKNIEFYGMDNFWGKYLTDKLDDIKNLNNLGANFIYADQGNFTDWAELKKEYPSYFNFIIDDASHYANHMMVSLWQSKDLLKSGGIYFMEDIQNPARSRGKFTIDNSIVAEDLLESEHTGIIESRLLNSKQNKDINDSFELLELVLDKNKLMYLGVFRKK